MIEFDWDDEKNTTNIIKHGVDFRDAVLAFDDPERVIVFDKKHSDVEDRWFCYGKVGGKVLSVRFTMRDNMIRIIGAGYWRQWRKHYGQERHQKHSNF